MSLTPPTSPMNFLAKSRRHSYSHILIGMFAFTCGAIGIVFSTYLTSALGKAFAVGFGLISCMIGIAQGFRSLNRTKNATNPARSFGARDNDETNLTTDIEGIHLKYLTKPPIASSSALNSGTNTKSAGIHPERTVDVTEMYTQNILDTSTPSEAHQKDGVTSTHRNEPEPVVLSAMRNGVTTSSLAALPPTVRARMAGVPDKMLDDRRHILILYDYAVSQRWLAEFNVFQIPGGQGEAGWWEAHLYRKQSTGNQLLSKARADSRVLAQDEACRIYLMQIRQI